MKTCPKCNIFKVKNSYEMCYTCHNKEESSSELEKNETIKRETIPKTVRNAVWINYYVDKRIGKCLCCLREQISIGNFNCGHIVSHNQGGKTTLDNLIPICTLCNTSMGTYNLNDFIKKYNLHYGLSGLTIVPPTRDDPMTETTEDSDE
jgi:5-methylcytosine-specific restriction endonuclease McrA